VSTESGAQPSPQAVANAARQAALKRYMNARSVHWRATTNGPLSEERALDYLRNVVQQMPEEQGAPIKAALAAGNIRPRRLAPRDGVVFESPQGRVFALVGLPPLIAPPAPPPEGEGETEQEQQDEASGGGSGAADV